MKVLFIYRKPNKLFYSIERVFEIIFSQQPKEINTEKYFVPFYNSGLISILKNILDARKQNADIYHVTGDIHYVVLGLPINKTVLTIHDCVFVNRRKGLKNLIIRKLFLDWPVRRAKYITTISEKTKQEIIELTGCSPEKILVIPNPVTSSINYSVNEINDVPVLLFIGSKPNKNLERVIDAIENLRCKLLVIGKLSDLQISLLQKKSIDFEAVIDLSDEEVANCYEKCDIVLFPSLYEGFGLPIIEAQKAGRAVVTSNISPMKDVCGSGACLVDPYSVDSIREGINKVIFDKTYREKIIQAGLKNVKNYSPEVISGLYSKLYAEVNAGQI